MICTMQLIELTPSVDPFFIMFSFPIYIDFHSKKVAPISADLFNRNKVNTLKTYYQAQERNALFYEK